MLIEFSVKNFTSFKNTARLSLLASKLKSREESLDENTVFEANGHRLLTSAAIYGANASGKSNVAKAMIFMDGFVRTSATEMEVGEEINVKPFLLDLTSHDEPSEFEIVFIAEGVQYRYGFEVTKERIVREWLFHVPTKRESLLFERTGQEINVKSAFQEGKGLEGRTRENVLFLSVAAQWNGKIAETIVHWFRRFHIVSGLNDFGLRLYTTQCISKGKNAVDILHMLKAFDINLENIAIEKVNLTPEMMKELPGELQAYFSGSDLELPDAVKITHVVYDDSGDKASTIQFDLDEQESEGTKKLFAFAGPIIDTLTNGLTLIIDEYDARLHPMISREIVKLFNSKLTNPKHAQLVFMTHDTNLLHHDLLRRDQIWFVEKDKLGASELYSMAEFPVRNDSSFEQDYIFGKFGAIPFLGGLRRVIESALEATDDPTKR